MPGRAHPVCLPTGRFNERLVLSLSNNRNCIMMDDELNILPTSSLVKFICPIPDTEKAESASEKELKELVQSLADTQVLFSKLGGSRSHHTHSDGDPAASPQLPVVSSRVSRPLATVS